jgi:hypothetical protein
MTDPIVGDPVIYTDPKGIDHIALPTAVWTPQCINVVFIDSDESKKDQYGRQIARETSVSRVGPSTVHGRVFRMMDDPKPEYKSPMQS